MRVLLYAACNSLLVPNIMKQSYCVNALISLADLHCDVMSTPLLTNYTS